jgi:DNA-binding beta-propeller fold protein YncE
MSPMNHSVTFGPLIGLMGYRNLSEAAPAPDQTRGWRTGWRLSVIAAAGAALVAVAISAAVIGLVPTGHRPPVVGPVAESATAYVLSYEASTVTPIDVATGVAGTPIRAGNGPDGIAITPDGKTAYVADIGGTVTPINLATGRAGTPIQFGAYSDPVAIVIPP